MDPMTLGLIGAGIGMAKHELIDAPRERRQRILAAATAQYSPWTKMTPQLPQETDALGTGLQGGMAGFQLGQGMEMQNLQKDYMNQMMMNGGSSSSTPMGGAPTMYESGGAIGRTRLDPRNGVYNNMGIYQARV